MHRRLRAQLERIEKPNYLHSGVRGRSCLSNARVHAGALPLGRLSIQPFFPLVSAVWVAKFFQDALACSPDAVAMLTRPSTYDDHVPTGSGLSQLLAFFRGPADVRGPASVGAGRRLALDVPRRRPDILGRGRNARILVAGQGARAAMRICPRPGAQLRCADQKLVTGMMIEGDTCTQLSSREFQFWSDTQALAGADIEQRAAAARRLPAWLRCPPPMKFALQTNFTASAGAKVAPRMARRTLPSMPCRRPRVCLRKPPAANRWRTRPGPADSGDTTGAAGRPLRFCACTTVCHKHQ